MPKRFPALEQLPAAAQVQIKNFRNEILRRKKHWSDDLLSYFDFEASRQPAKVYLQALVDAGIIGGCDRDLLWSYLHQDDAP